MTTPWIRTVDPEDAEGRLAEAYGWQARKLGRPTEFTQLGSLDAEVVHARVVADDGEVARAARVQRLDEIFRKATEAEAAAHDRRAVGNQRHRIGGALQDFVHGR